MGQEPPRTQAAARSWAVSRTQDPVGWEPGFVASLRLGSESREQKEEEEERRRRRRRRRRERLLEEIMTRRAAS